MKELVKIGCWSAFWGDTSTGAHQLVKQGNVDYLVGDYLSEVTMGILAKLKNKKSDGMGEGGYISEFVTSVWKPLIKTIMKKKIKVITNAGGMNPLACKKAIEDISEKSGFKVKVAAIYGDDITNTIKNMNINAFSLIEEEKIPKVNKFMSANAYFGAIPIVQALIEGADVIVTGRCVDSALVLAPLMYEFGWKSTDYDLLASGSLAGHIIECGCQCTGGNFTDWEKSFKEGWDNIGFPIVECKPDGTFVVTKPEKTGGIVTTGTVGEQMVYEIHDPANYILPDVILDFTQVTLKQIEKNRVFVSRARGRAPTNSYKVSLTYQDGFMISGSLMIGGIDAEKKAKAVAYSILSKVRKLLSVFGLDDFDDYNIEVIGSETTYGPHSRTLHSREIILRITVSHKNPKALGIFAKEMAPSATGMAPGISGSGGGRPKISPKVQYSSVLCSKESVPISISVGSNFNLTSLYPYLGETTIESFAISKPSSNYIKTKEKTIKVPLITLALGRSGDKGDNANIGIIARETEYFEFLKNVLTSEVVYEYMKHVIDGKIIRYELPGINAFNFVCSRSLGGGGLESLRVDRQGKCLAQMLLDIPIDVPFKWIGKLNSKL
eukprot:gene8379-204_t